MIVHPSTGLAVGDPLINPLQKPPTEAEAKFFFDNLILSASGWRGVFAKADEDASETISPAATYCAAKMADAFSDYIMSLHEKPVLALGIDTRPTGPAIADVMARIFIAKNIRVQYAFICAAPEIMAWTRRSALLPADSPNHIDAFCYISASHNPQGHNGVKFGLSDGAVLPASEAAKLILQLKKNAAIASNIEEMHKLAASANTKTLTSMYTSITNVKRQAVSDYTLFTMEVAGLSSDLATSDIVLNELSNAIKSRGAGIIADYNGSARTLSIDENFFTGLGVNFIKINDKPRRFAHRIVPEGESLDQCCIALNSAHKVDNEFVLGYVPDCDGDRGNIVYFDAEANKSKAIEAQQTFALAVLAELTVQKLYSMKNKTNDKFAVACNDATSMRIDAICSALDVDVFRSETGEANVVGLARKLRQDGYVVRVLGEGSNGGVITHPAYVRDPINTVTALLKLLYLRDTDSLPGPFKLWLEKSNQNHLYSDNFDFSDILLSLPKYTTTSVFETQAALRIKNNNHLNLKTNYEKIFYKKLPSIQQILMPVYGPTTCKLFSSLGDSETIIPANNLSTTQNDFRLTDKGGLKICFYDEADQPVSFFWMRGSGTEPVFRVMVDIKGDNTELESLLLSIHSNMVQEADSML